LAQFRLIPRDERFFDLFEQAADQAMIGASTLQRMLADIEHAGQYRQEMEDIEHAGDKVIHEVMDKLNRTFVTPLDPEDIRTVASNLDDITDLTHAAVERVVLYQVTKPYAGAVELVAVLEQSVQLVRTVVGKLRSLEQRAQINELCIEINRLENAGDKIYRDVLGSLFCAGDLMELFRWKEICVQIEQAINHCESLADIVESLVTKHS
jgi:uncharacterized protein